MEPEPALEISTAVFTFSGDCWVNIYDASGERIAWGIKKSGYVMSVEGVAPLEVTLGKPELAIIEFNGQLVDLSGFNAGNIAKFTLPLAL
jgi:cytoskeleton protein RodZ